MLAAAACDTGDGTTLQEPTAPTTLPLPDTTPLSSVPITTAPAGTADALPTSEDPATLPGDADPGAEFQLFAPWADGGPIDERYGCDGSNVSPALSWRGVPAGTVELAVSLVDETNLSNGQPFVHWVMSGIPADGPAALGEGEVPPGAIQALNFFGDVAYAGPCPNPGDTNTYRLTLYALPQQLELADGTPAAEFLDELTFLSLQSTSLSGSRSR